MNDLVKWYCPLRDPTTNKLVGERICYIGHDVDDLLAEKDAKIRSLEEYIVLLEKIRKSQSSTIGKIDPRCNGDRTKLKTATDALRFYADTDGALAQKALKLMEEK